MRAGRPFGMALAFAALMAGGSAQAFAQANVVAADQAAARARMTSDVLGAPVTTSTITSVTPFAPPSPADPDIGDQILLQPQEKHQPFTVFADYGAYWTSNAQLLDQSNGSGDTFMTGGVGVQYLPYLGSNLFAEFSAEQRIFRYARNPDLDFNGLTVTAGLIYVIRALDDLTLFTNYEYDLLTQRGFNREIYHDHVWNVGARKAFVLSRAHFFYASAYAAFNLGGWPSFAQSNDFVGLVGYQLGITRNVKFDLYYRGMAQAYRFADRSDYNQLIGGGLTFEVTRWLSVQAVSSLAINNSTEPFFDYFAANLGGGVAVSFNF